MLQHDSVVDIHPARSILPSARTQRLAFQPGNPLSNLSTLSSPSHNLLQSLLSLLLRLLSSVLNIQHLALGLTLGVLQALVVHVNATDLCGTDAEDEEVDTSQRDVLGADDEAPARPDCACAHESEVLGEGEGFGGAGEVGGAGEDHAPFHYWGPAGVLTFVRWLGYGVMGFGGGCLLLRMRMRFGECGELATHCGGRWEWREGSVPEVDCLGTDGAVPELLEASGLSARRGSMAAGICALEEGSEGAEDAGAGAERHDGELCPGL